jgi:serine/threonine-protein kinase
LTANSSANALNARSLHLNEAAGFLEQRSVFYKLLEDMNIVHRDIKPENNIVSDDGKAYFLDFGIDSMLGAPSLTATEALAGPHTPGYAAPERFNNLKSDIDSRADLFSIGVATYERLSGKNPFREGATSQLGILQHYRSPPFWRE